jgi:hypothetical protein
LRSFRLVALTFRKTINECSNDPKSVPGTTRIGIIRGKRRGRVQWNLGAQPDFRERDKAQWVGAMHGCAEEELMKFVVTAIAAAALVLGSASAGLAKGAKGHAGGKAHIGKTHVKAGTSARAKAPGQRFKADGAVAGYPGASGYAPGQRMKADGSVPGYPGASGYAPGHLRDTTGASVRIR